MSGVEWHWDGNMCMWFAHLAGLSMMVSPDGDCSWNGDTDQHNPPSDERSCTWWIDGDAGKDAPTIAAAQSAAISAAVELLCEALVASGVSTNEVLASIERRRQPDGGH